MDWVMASDATNQLLNGVLIQMSRSLLQYASEASMWVRAEAVTAAGKLEAVAQRQRVAVGRLAQLLDGRDFAVDFGSFPTEYTDLQFLALKSLVSGLINGQRKICEAAQGVLGRLQSGGDAEAVALLGEILADQQAIESELVALGGTL